MIFLFFYRTRGSSTGIFKRFVLVLKTHEKKSSPKIFNLFEMDLMNGITFKMRIEDDEAYGFTNTNANKYAKSHFSNTKPIAASHTYKYKTNHLHACIQKKRRKMLKVLKNIVFFFTKLKKELTQTMAMKNRSSD